MNGPLKTSKNCNHNLNNIFFFQMKSEFIRSKTETPLLLITLHSWDLLLLKLFIYHHLLMDPAPTMLTEKQLGSNTHSLLFYRGYCAGLFPDLDVFTVTITDSTNTAVWSLKWIGGNWITFVENVLCHGIKFCDRRFNPYYRHSLTSLHFRRKYTFTALHSFSIITSYFSESD